MCCGSKSNRYLFSKQILLSLSPSPSQENLFRKKAGNGLKFDTDFYPSNELQARERETHYPERKRRAEKVFGELVLREVLSGRRLSHIHIWSWRAVRSVLHLLALFGWKEITCCQGITCRCTLCSGFENRPARDEKKKKLIPLSSGFVLVYFPSETVHYTRSHFPLEWGVHVVVVAPSSCHVPVQNNNTSLSVIPTSLSGSRDNIFWRAKCIKPIKISFYVSGISLFPICLPPSIIGIFGCDAINLEG